jgi:alpha-galactosidase
MLVPVVARAADPARTKTASRRIERIDGIYLDALDWAEASTGWGQAQRNRSIMEQPMTLAGRSFPRGLGAHAVSRIVYQVPEGFSAFAATIGKDQEVAGGSVVFVIEADGREVFRSAVFRNDSPAREISIPLAGVKRLVLVVEDAGDGIGADHADWAEARLLR